jgi:hypothetical protein
MIATRAIVSATALLLACGLAGAQQAEDGRRIYNEQLRLRLDARRQATEGLALDGGGWFTFSYFQYDDALAGKVRSLGRYQLRGWAGLSVDGVHNFYGRGMLGWEDWSAGDNPSETGDDYIGPHVERAWYQWDLRQALINDTGEPPANWFQAKVGRQYVVFGTGLALSLPLDAIELTGAMGPWRGRVLMAQTLRNDNNIDLSPAVFDDMERCFWGFEIAYEGFSRHRPFAYVLTQTDHTDEDPVNPYQEYDYDSTYIGLGSTGSVALPNLGYQVELVGQTGRSYARSVNFAPGPRETICALALDARLEYVWNDHPMTPRVNAEYLWASGDDDRALSATATDNGNAPGTRDTAFNAFGFRDTGLAFAPRISNLHMWSVGASVHPWRGRHRLLDDLEIGAKVFAYMKDRENGAASDPTTAGTTDPFLGVEADLFVNWRITSDVSATVRYGVFNPAGGVADAYDDWRHFILAAVTYSF